MKKNLLTAILMTIATTVLFGIFYPLVVTALTQLLFPKQANGQLIRRGDQVIGSRLIGQPFTSARYFHPRPSAAGMSEKDTENGPMEHTTLTSWPSASMCSSCLSRSNHSAQLESS